MIFPTGLLKVPNVTTIFEVKREFTDTDSTISFQKGAAERKFTLQNDGKIKVIKGDAIVVPLAYAKAIITCFSDWLKDIIPLYLPQTGEDEITYATFGTGSNPKLSLSLYTVDLIYNHSLDEFTFGEIPMNSVATITSLKRAIFETRNWIDRGFLIWSSDLK